MKLYNCIESSVPDDVAMFAMFKFLDSNDGSLTEYRLHIASVPMGFLLFIEDADNNVVFEVQHIFSSLRECYEYSLRSIQ